PEKAEEIDFRRLGENRDHHDAPARTRQLRHHLRACCRAGDFEDHVGAGAGGLFVDLTQQIGLEWIHGVKSELAGEGDAERIHFAYSHPRSFALRDQGHKQTDWSSAEHYGILARGYSAHAHIVAGDRDWLH